MPKQLIYRLKIDGGYTPDTIPMKRLSEYMSDLAGLLGEPSSVHFYDLEEGSAIVAAAIDDPAIPKVERRVASISRGEAQDDLRIAFETLDKRLADDNAVGSLSAYVNGLETGAVVIDFPGRERPKPLDYGLVRQRGSIEGMLVNVGGRDKTSHLQLEDRDRTYTGINVSRELAKEIAKHLYGSVIRLHGTGRWRRDEDGVWQLNRFNVDSYDVLDDTPLHDALASIRSVSGSGWAEEEDPIGYLSNLRDEPDERPH